jgi:hypothetical protein
VIIMPNQWQSTDGSFHDISAMNDMHLLYAYRKVAETLISEENDELEAKGVLLFDEIKRRKLVPLAPRSELEIHNSKMKAEQKRKRAEEKAKKERGEI